MQGGIVTVAEDEPIIRSIDQLRKLGRNPATRFVSLLTMDASPKGAGRMDLPFND